MKEMYYILAGLTLGIILLSGCIQQGKDLNINPGTSGTTIVNEETTGGPKQTYAAPPGFQIDYSQVHPASATGASGFEMNQKVFLCIWQHLPMSM